MSARKDDAGKPPMSLIPRSALLAEARVLARGRDKYGAHNWRSGGGMAWSRLIDAAMRHLTAFADGEDIDDGEGGSGELHLANARCCLAFLIEYYEKKLGTDDRYRQPTQEPTKGSVVWQVVVASKFTKAPLVVATYPDKGVAERMAKTFHATHWPEPAYVLSVREVKND